MDRQTDPEAGGRQTSAQLVHAPAETTQLIDAGHETRAHDGGGAPPRWLSALASPALALPLTAATGVVLFIVNLGGYPLYTKGEPREAVTVFDIVHGGGVILPMRAGVEIPSKPLMMHWLAAIVSLVAGHVNEWTVRMPSAMLAIVGMVICYLYVRRLFEERSALFAALILGTSFQYLQAGTGARVDMTLTFFMELAFFEFIMIAQGLSARTTLLYLAIAFAVLTKGPVGLALPALVGLIWIVLWWRWEVVARLKLWHGVAIVGILAGGWYVAASIVGGMPFVHKQILSENLYRLFHHKGVDEGHAHPFYYMELALAAGFLPWTPVAILALVQYVRRPRHLDPRFGYMLVWFLAVLIFYNFPQSKRGVYLLALYPALATLVAIAISDAVTSRAQLARWVDVVSCAAGVFFLMAGALGLIGLVTLYLYWAPMRLVLSLLGITVEGLIPHLAAAASEYFVLSIIIPLATGGVGYYLLVTRPRAEKMLFGVVAGFACLVLAVNLVVVPAIADTLSLKRFASAAMKTVGTDSIGYMGSLDYGFAFYSRRDIPIISLRKRPTEYVLCWDDGYKLLGPAWQKRLDVVLSSNPTELDGTGRMLLLKLAGNGPVASTPGASAPSPAAPKPPAEPGPAKPRASQPAPPSPPPSGSMPAPAPSPPEVSL